MATKLKFGSTSAMSSPTPKLANYIFRTVLIVTTAFTIWLAGTQLIAESAKFELTLAAKILDFLAWGIGRLFGFVDEKEVKNG
jgi:hypothetical protein